MPIFDYQCSSCERTKEFICSFSSDPDEKKECPDCKGDMSRDIKIYKTSFKPGLSFHNNGYVSN